MPTPSDHQARAASYTRKSPVRCAVLTVSDTRDAATDRSGPLICELVREFGHEAVETALVADEPAEVDDQMRKWLGSADVQVIISTGGTGFAKRDTTVETAQRLITKPIEGFGELFRSVSYDQIGSAAMLSRAVGGLVEQSIEHGGDTFLFVLPGSTNAVETAMRKLIGPELGHLIWQRLGP